MNRKFLLTVFISCIISVSSFSQVREIPQAIRETFSNQYPKAENADFKDRLAKVDVNFEMDGEKMIASYGNKGDWKGTEKDWRFDELDESIQDGFRKSKFADWDITETKILYLPGGSEQYRIRVRRNDVQKKYLYFNTKGRLIREAVTL